MEWLQDDLQLDAGQARLIARGMKRVAEADGLLHQRELALISAFDRDIPPDAPTIEHVDGEVREAYLRSLILVALADGEVSSAEYDEICSLMSAQAVPRDTIDARILDVKRDFMRRFEGVTVFKDAVAEVAAHLGLD